MNIESIEYLSPAVVLASGFFALIITLIGCGCVCKAKNITDERTLEMQWYIYRINKIQKKIDLLEKGEVGYG